MLCHYEHFLTKQKMIHDNHNAPKHTCAHMHSQGTGPVNSYTNSHTCSTNTRQSKTVLQLSLHETTLNRNKNTEYRLETKTMWIVNKKI